MKNFETSSMYFVVIVILIAYRLMKIIMNVCQFIFLFLNYKCTCIRKGLKNCHFVYIPGIKIRSNHKNKT